MSALRRLFQAARIPTWLRIFFVVFTICSSLFGCVFAPDRKNDVGWKPLFNGKNLDGRYVVIKNAKSDDPNHLVQIEDGAIHMYKDVPNASQQPVGYIVTEKEYSNYSLRLEYKWGGKRFAPRANVRRDAGILYHVIGKDGVWPRSVECQIQENDVGDIFTVYTRVTALVDPATTNLISNAAANEAGIIRTNQSSQPVFLEPEKGGIALIQGAAGGIRRVIRNPMNEQDGWNKVEVVVRGNDATYIVNGKVNNRATRIEQMVNKEWVPLKQGKIALQLEYAEVLYRNVEIKELKE
jgi:hypothetical protein